MRIVFFGASKLGYKACEEIIKLNYDIRGILTIPKFFKISYSAAGVENVLFEDFGYFKEAYAIPVIKTEEGINDVKYVNLIKEWNPDLILAIGWYYMIPEGIREIPPLGCVGVHHSLLPKYRGGAPLSWAIINGERETGTTLFYLAGGADSGDIIGQKSIPIVEADTIASLYEKADMVALELLEEFLPKIADGTAPRIPQDHSKASQYPQRRPEDGRIDWSKSPKEIKDFIRALSKPYPGAYTYIGNKKVIIWDADIITDGRGHDL